MDYSTLTNSDPQAIATELGCTSQQVRKTLDGNNGRRPTLLQRNILMAATLRVHQNLEFKEYCRELKLGIAPSPSNFLGNI
jgi:hypothetical protein